MYTWSRMIASVSSYIFSVASSRTSPSHSPCSGRCARCTASSTAPYPSLSLYKNRLRASLPPAATGDCKSAAVNDPPRAAKTATANVEDGGRVCCKRQSVTLLAVGELCNIPKVIPFSFLCLLIYFVHHHGIILNFCCICAFIKF